MDPKEDEVREVLVGLSKASHRDPELHRAEVNEVYQKLSDFLYGYHPSISVLLAALEENAKEIQGFMSQTPKSATQAEVTGAPSSSTDEDARVTDLQPGKNSLSAKFRKGLSQISLARMFTKWEQEHKQGETTVNVFARDLSASAPEKHKRLYIQEFLHAYKGQFINQRVALDGIKHGIKCLVFETLYGHGGILAILSFVYHQFRSLNFKDLRKLETELRRVDWVVELAFDKTQWYEACQEAYEGTLLFPVFDIID
ncbi:MAG: hypothetical protein Q9213_007311 [Squamulea squamosa]